MHCTSSSEIFTHCTIIYSNTPRLFCSRLLPFQKCGEVLCSVQFQCSSLVVLSLRDSKVLSRHFFKFHEENRNLYLLHGLSISLLLLYFTKLHYEVLWWVFFLPTQIIQQLGPENLNIAQALHNTFLHS